MTCWQCHLQTPSVEDWTSMGWSIFNVRPRMSGLNYKNLIGTMVLLLPRPISFQFWEVEQGLMTKRTWILSHQSYNRSEKMTVRHSSQASSKGHMPSGCSLLILCFWVLVVDGHFNFVPLTPSNNSLKSHFAKQKVRMSTLLFESVSIYKTCCQYFLLVFFFFLVLSQKCKHSLFCFK